MATLSPSGKLEELTHTMGRYRINIFYCNFYIHVCNGVGPQVLTTLVTALPLGIPGTYLDSARCPGKTLARCQQMTDTRFISMKERTDMNMGLDFLRIRTW